MSNTIYLFAAFGTTWVILFAYIFRMLKEQKALEIRVEKIREILDKDLKD